MNKKISKIQSITIGIPAYNEGQNIGHLLVSIFNQRLKNVILDEIIIVSDGSTDNTVQSVKKIRDKRISLVVNKKRLGQNATQNEIVKRARGDVLVLLNADVLLIGDRFLEEVLAPFLKNNTVGIVGVETRSAVPQTFVERVIGNSHIFKTLLYKHINNGNNIYMCYGAARVFRKSLYNTLRWPRNCPEDSYAYLFAIKSGFLFRYESGASLVFRSPATLKDHIKQSSRFRGGRKALEKLFGEEMVGKEFSLPPLLVVKTFFSLLPSRPLSLLSYLILQSYTAIISLSVRTYNDKHDISISTKRIISVNAVVYALLEKI